MKFLGLMASTEGRGTLLYLPPERFGCQPYDERTDIWSLGITLIEIVYGAIPYDIKEFDSQHHFVQIMNIIKHVDADKIMNQCFSKEYSKELRSFTRSCLNELSSRPKCIELMGTNLYKSFIAKDDNENIMKFFINIYSVISHLHTVCNI